jgi:phosphatidylglycerophosphatase A
MRFTIWSLRKKRKPEPFRAIGMDIPKLKNQITIFCATGGLIGYAPVAPGTFGSLAALPLCLLIASVDHHTGAIALLVLAAVSTWIAHNAEKLVGQNDPKQVVIDEICGMAIALFALPFEPRLVIAGFALFRVFDILKPFPIRWVEKKIPGGLGIVLDDIIAGILANALLRVGVLLVK